MSIKIFTHKVYSLVSKIPRGKVATYGQITRLAGNPKAARAVGMAMKHNPDTRCIPCHRVVASDGSLGGYSVGKGIETKKELLLKEGVVFSKNKVQMPISQWNAR